MKSKECINEDIKMTSENNSIEIRTERLLLVPYGMKYLDTAYEYTSDIENTKYMMFLPNDSIDEAKEYLTKCDEEWSKENPILYEFAIIFEGVHVGAVGIDILDDERTKAELGWSLNKKYWRKGITSEAAFAVVDYAIKEIGIKYFVAHCDSENVASYKLMEKLGMKLKDRYGGRKNKAMEGERIELEYEMYV